MGAFGERLRREREMRGVTLDEIAGSTKISKRHLEALERESFETLPGGIFNKGFVRAYARYLGIDEEQALADYRAADLRQSPVDERFPLEIHRRPDPEMNPRRSFFPVMLAVVALAGLLGGWTYWVKHRPAPQTEASAKPVSVPPRPQAGPSSSVAATPSESAPASNQPPANGQSFTVRVKVNEASWVSIKADGQTVTQRIMNAGEEQAASASREILVTIGNAGGVEVSFNGTGQGALGEEGKVRTLTFTPEGLQISPVPQNAPQLQ